MRQCGALRVPESINNDLGALEVCCGERKNVRLLGHAWEGDAVGMAQDMQGLRWGALIVGCAWAATLRSRYMLGRPQEWLALAGIICAGSHRRIAPASQINRELCALMAAATRFSTERALPHGTWRPNWSGGFRFLWALRRRLADGLRAKRLHVPSSPCPHPSLWAHLARN